MDYDSPWKDAVEDHFRLFADLLLPWVVREVDWEQVPVSLEQELRKAHPEAATGKRIVDRLLRLSKIGGEVRYLHIEVQAQWEEDFPHRVWTYNKKATGSRTVTCTTSGAARRRSSTPW